MKGSYWEMVLGTFKWSNKSKHVLQDNVVLRGKTRSKNVITKVAKQREVKAAKII